MQAYHRQQRKLEKRKYITACMNSLTWSWSEHSSDCIFTCGTWNSSVKAAVWSRHVLNRQTFHFCPGAIAVEVILCPWDDGSLTAASLMQADGSLHLHCQENNSVLHCGLHPLQRWDNVSGFHCKRRRQSISFSLQWHKVILKNKATVSFQLKLVRNWQCNQPCPSHDRAYLKNAGPQFSVHVCELSFIVLYRI